MKAIITLIKGLIFVKKAKENPKSKSKQRKK